MERYSRQLEDRSAPRILMQRSASITQLLQRMSECAVLVEEDDLLPNFCLQVQCHAINILILLDYLPVLLK
jgi:hypothetical protein